MRYSGRLEQRQARARGPWDPNKRKLSQGQADRIARSLAQHEQTKAIIAAGNLPYEVKPAPVQLRPWQGLSDPRCEGYVVLRYGKVVKKVGRPY